ncbi:MULTISPECIES: ribonuclease domain-containing protein [unclassified Amycolatopsis]|uniref:ribonuclease domain-containing protein n=1 Tax=unclassified Amycolatopsis TaxID=2618356 RepID=UPI002875C185|nr:MULTISPECIES: ribonuclease domain-containing protein [unclassified Amycolatopsis]MDS0138118.1 ribonuclease [Amycolatopsis sp. 505]MDS0143969.1 ribonuclease [Amycolatopsis sp. CM201R]
MTNYRSRLAAVLFALLATLFAGVTAPSPAVAAQNACGNLSGFSHTTLSALPAEATTTYRLIQTNGPFPYPKNDGVVFDNREGILPACASGYYHEYTVPTPGSSTRGTRRIVTGSAGEYFYTGDHYATFKVIDISGGTTHACGDLSGLAEIGYSQLSSAAKTVVNNVRNGTSAGTTYENREGVLPACASGHYKLFAVAANDRVISGKAGELAYTPDRYATFERIDLNS